MTDRLKIAYLDCFSGVAGDMLLGAFLHAGLEEEHQLEIGITDSLIRLSIGVEHPDDIIYALDHALKAVEKNKKTEEMLMAL